MQIRTPRIIKDLFTTGVALSMSLTSLWGELKTYSYPEEVTASDTFQVWVGGEPCFVYQNPVASFAAFEMGEGPVEVKVLYRDTAKHAMVRPLWSGITAIVEDGQIVMDIDQPGTYSVELNGLFEDKLFLFANPPVESPDVSDGRLHYESGKLHEPGIVFLKSGDRVFIEGGAVVRGLFVIEDAQDVVIEGPGIIDASILADIEFPEGYRKRVIQMNDSEKITLKHFIISDGRNWQIVPNRSHSIEINGVKIVSNDGGDDGIDIVRSSDVEIRNCFIHTKDDCIAIKSHTPDEQLRATHKVLIEDCVFWNTIWGNGFEIGFELRTDRVHDITLRNSDFIHVEKGAVLSIHNADWAIVEDVLFENIRVEDARQKLLDFAIFWTWWSLDAPRQSEFEARYQQGGLWDNVMNFKPGEKAIHARNRGHIRNITVENLQIVDGGLPFSIFQGFDENHRISNVTIKDLYLHGNLIETAAEAKLVSEFADGVRFETTKRAENSP